ncbi:G-type lectin S-receptor-like serine/threonine-protein kinase B120 isoform X2 [Rosa rugosa]|uniref:G-type lectin S-receptor-like serine/threonine-protein kinase B120 isoform X2 n=1 Tax=Rosa rugosa TaxID=74645 RepID=UPI002B41285E|nr:G-type lectin S-receptor-like serine/threonine-protein kinase B120 isoform X2 [Rosa rugosa]
MNSFVLFQSSLIPLLLITSFLSINFQSSVCADDAVEYANCSQPITCGGVKSKVSYPFRGANRADYCGKSGFDVTCEANVPMITMENIKFRILDMTTTTPTVKVARQDYWETICPPTYVSTNLNFSLFTYSSGLLNVSFWYGCNTTFSVLGNSHECNSSVTASYLTQRGASSLPSDPVSTGACDYKVLVPVFASASADLDSNATDIETAIDGGFDLDVLNADTDLCNSCLSSGGVCGQNMTTVANEFKCFCQTTTSSTTTCTESSSQSPNPAPSNSAGRKRTIVIATFIATPGLLAIVFGYFLWKKTLGKRSETIKYLSAAGVENDTELPLFSLRSILVATNNFSEANKLGEGGFGPVYKGILPENQEVAIKRLSKKSGQGQQEFMNELKLIAKLQHTKLVRLLGCCTEAEEMMLIYEYMPNRSLDKFLFDPSEKTKLDWDRRLRIIEGIAQGLLYIHKYSRLKIIHRDLKASNILLDGTMNPKISDFGMAKIFDINQTEANTNRVVGTYGYMSPEYARYGHFSEKSDVFSFGVLLLEIAWDLWKEGRGIEVIDASIRETLQAHEALRCINIGLLCVQESAADRPAMASVIHMLQGNEAASLPPTKAPAFSTQTNFSTIGPSSQTPTNYSNNALTISLPEAR